LIIAQHRYFHLNACNFVFNTCESCIQRVEPDIDLVKLITDTRFKVAKPRFQLVEPGVDARFKLVEPGVDARFKVVKPGVDARFKVV